MNNTVIYGLVVMSASNLSGWLLAFPRDFLDALDKVALPNGRIVMYKTMVPALNALAVLNSLPATIFEGNSDIGKADQMMARHAPNNRTISLRSWPASCQGLCGTEYILRDGRLMSNVKFTSELHPTIIIILCN